MFISGFKVAISLLVERNDVDGDWDTATGAFCLKLPEGDIVLIHSSSVAFSLLKRIILTKLMYLVGKVSKCIT